MTKECIKYIKSFIINTPQEGMVPLIPNKNQLKVLKALFNDKRIVVSTSRQSGMTSIMLAFGTWYSTNHNKVVLFITDSLGMQTHCKEVIRRFEEFTGNQSKILFRVGSLIHFKENLPTVDALLFDNAAYVTNNEYVWEWVKPKIHKDGYVWINSTPRQDWFDKMSNDTWENTWANPNKKIVNITRGITL